MTTLTLLLHILGFNLLVVYYVLYVKLLRACDSDDK